MDRWDRAQQHIAKRVMHKSPLNVTLTKQMKGAVYNAVSGTMVGGTTSNYTFQGFIESGEEKNVDGKVREFSDEFKGPTDIDFADVVLEVTARCVDAQGVEHYDIPPEVGDLISYNAQVYTVKKANSLAPTDKPLLWTLELRK